MSTKKDCAQKNYEKLLMRHKSLQKKYIRNTKSLRKQKRFLRQVIDLNPNFIFAKDREGKFTLVNQAVADAYGTTPPLLIGKTDADFNPDIKEVQHFKNDDLKVMDTLNDLVIPEEVLTDAQGNSRILKTIKRPIIDANGIANQVLGVATDITKSKQMEIELKSHRERLEQMVEERTKALSLSQEKLRKAERMAAIGALAAGIAHEINNPIGAILLSVENTLDEIKEIENLVEIKTIFNELAEKVSKNANRCSSIVRGVLMFAQSQSNSERWLNQINPLVLQACELVNQIFPSNRKSLHLDLQSDLPPANINPLEIEQIVINLIKNSIESADRLVNVFVRTKYSANKKIIIEVEDDGSGMNEETQRTVFEPFFTTRNSLGGSGLGLSIVKDLVNKHQGDISLKSKIGEGSTFSVLLPLDN